MNFIAVSFGYNQYSIFNTNTSTQTLTDNITNLSLSEIVANLNARDNSLTKEIEIFGVDEENIRKDIARLEQDKKKEEEKIAETKRLIEEQIKKEAQEAKTVVKKGKGAKPKKTSKKIDNPDNKVLNQIIDDIKNKQIALIERGSNKERYIDKKKKLAEILDKFIKMNKNKMNIKIELIDHKGDKVNINTKGQAYALEYLEGQRCYELNKYLDNQNIETGVFEPLKYDGYCIRTIEEDIKFEENEKGKDKKKGNKPSKK